MDLADFDRLATSLAGVRHTNPSGPAPDVSHFMALCRPEGEAGGSTSGVTSTATAAVVTGEDAP